MRVQTSKKVKTRRNTWTMCYRLVSLEPNDHINQCHPYKFNEKFKKFNYPPHTHTRT